MHMTTLEDLYYGNISLCECDMKRGSRMEKLRIMVKVMVGMEMVEEI